MLEFGWDLPFLDLDEFSAMERERESERERARIERQEKQKKPVQITPTFSQPIRVSDPSDDIESRLQSILGPYKSFRPLIDSHVPSTNIIGVPNQLPTPTSLKSNNPLRTNSPKILNNSTDKSKPSSSTSSPYNKERKEKSKKNGAITSNPSKSSNSSSSHQKHPGKSKNTANTTQQSSSSQHRPSSSHSKPQDIKTTPVKSERPQIPKSPVSKEKAKSSSHSRPASSVKSEMTITSAKPTKNNMQRPDWTEQKSKPKSKESSSTKMSDTKPELELKILTTGNINNAKTDLMSSIFDLDNDDQEDTPDRPSSKNSQPQGRSMDAIFKEMIDIQCPLTALPTPSKINQTQFPFTQTIKETGQSRPAMMAPHKKQPEHPEKNTDEQSNENGSEHNSSSDDDDDENEDPVRNNGGDHEDGSSSMKRALSSSSGSSSESESSESESSDSDVSEEEETNEQLKPGKWSLVQYVQRLQTEQNKSPGAAQTISTSNGPRFFPEQDIRQTKSPSGFGTFELPPPDSGVNKGSFNKTYDHLESFRDLSEKAKTPTLKSEKTVHKSSSNTKTSNPTVAPRKEQIKERKEQNKEKQKGGKQKSLPKKSKPSSKPIPSSTTKNTTKQTITPVKSHGKPENKKVKNSKVEPNNKSVKSKKKVAPVKEKYATPEFVGTSSESDDDNVSDRVCAAPQPQKSRNSSGHKLNVSHSPVVSRSPGVSHSPAVSHVSSESRSPERLESKKNSQGSKKSSHKVNKPRTNKEKSSSTKLKKPNRTTEEIFNKEITEQILSPIKSSSASIFNISESAPSRSHIVYKEDGNPSLVVKFDLENLDNIPRKINETHDEDSNDQSVYREEPKPVSSVRVQKRKPEPITEIEERQRVGVKKPKLITKSKSPRTEGYSTPHECDETRVERQPVLERQSSVTSMSSLQSDQSAKSDKSNSANRKQRKQPSIPRKSSTQKAPSKIREWPNVIRERRPDELESTNKMSRPCPGTTDHVAVVRPRPRVEISERPMGVDDYLKEAKKLKHFADALTDKGAKALAYVDAVLYFILCGNAMEDDQHISDEKPLTMYTDTIELIKFIHRFKDPEIVAVDKKLTILCYRCQAILYMRMFRLRKEAAWKHSQHLKEYFKLVSKSQQAPSPWNSSKCTGTPSPMSPTPSPAGSVGSIGSQSSNNGDPFSSSSQNRLSNGIGLMSPASVSITQKVHTIMSLYFTVTNHHLYSLDLWEKAETCLQENAEFFRELDQECGALSLYNSTLIDLVKYVRAGLRWLKETSHL
ncbi:uncharacterized protein [Antedon mediterranea]|uniref:uncharacterized protein isoform X2 n=1 Tax=Antedon mediterranea TaxID=105859 RepID=UPI003AF4E939